MGNVTSQVHSATQTWRNARSRLKGKLDRGQISQAVYDLAAKKADDKYKKTLLIIAGKTSDKNVDRDRRNVPYRAQKTRRGWSLPK